MVSSPALTPTPAASPDPSVCADASAPAVALSAMSSSLYGSDASSARACSSETGRRREGRLRLVRPRREPGPRLLVRDRPAPEALPLLDDLGHRLFKFAKIIRGERCCHVE